MALGTVRVRVGLSYDPLRLSPSAGDLYYRKLRGPFSQRENASHPTKTNTTKTSPHKKQKIKLGIIRRSTTDVNAADLVVSKNKIENTKS